jgi:hypothetical protein
MKTKPYFVILASMSHSIFQNFIGPATTPPQFDSTAPPTMSTPSTQNAFTLTSQRMLMLQAIARINSPRWLAG